MGKYTAYIVILLFTVLHGVPGAVSIADIMVKMENNPEKHEGYGFPVYQSADSVYFATAAHVVENRRPEAIVIKWKGGGYETVSIRRHRRLDLALLGAKKGEAVVNPFRALIGKAEPGDAVYVLGRYAIVSESPTGTVTRVRGGYLEAEMSGVSVGSSGGPLIRKAIVAPNEKIVGLVYRYDGLTVKALPADVVMTFVRETLNLNDLNIHDIPFINFGISMNYFTTLSGQWSAIKGYYETDRYDITFRPFAEVMVHRYFGLLFEMNTFSLTGRTSEKYLQPVTFRNRMNGYVYGLRWHPGTTIQDFDGFFTLAYGRARIKPEIRFSGEDWQPLSSAGHTYDWTVESISAGYGINGVVYKYFLLGMAFDYHYYFTDYLYINAAEPYKKDDSGDYMITIRIYLGLSPRLPSSYIRLVR